MNSNQLREYKEKLRLTPRQREILTGLLLGDGHLETQNNGKTYRLKIGHGATQKKYVYWLFDEFREWIRPDMPYRKVSQGRVSYGFTTYSHGAFRFYGHQFYSKGSKTIPRILHRLLTPLSLAVWFMDDGSRKSMRHKTFILHTLGYPKADLERLKKIIQEKYNLEIALHSQKRGYWRIYLPSVSAVRFKNLIEPNIISSMRYKIDVDNKSYQTRPSLVELKPKE